MSVSNFLDLLPHVGHEIKVVTYGGKGIHAANVAIECMDCNEVLVDFDKNPDRKVQVIEYTADGVLEMLESAVKILKEAKGDRK